MSVGGTGGNPVRGLNYGASAAQENADFSDDPDPKGTAAGYVRIYLPLPLYVTQPFPPAELNTHTYTFTDRRYHR